MKSSQLQRDIYRAIVDTGGDVVIVADEAGPQPRDQTPIPGQGIRQILDDQQNLSASSSQPPRRAPASGALAEASHHTVHRRGPERNVALLVAYAPSVSLPISLMLEMRGERPQSPDDWIVSQCRFWVKNKT